jgi:hypothetical protein
VAVFDAYFSIPSVEETLLANLELTKGKSYEQIIQLIAVVSMLISAKFLEKTYPGVNKLNQII